ncbi:MAG: O-methyltransferase [Varibaculum sp.]|nr:O-methyltransferase [Varibaculum sp.]
MDKAVSWNWAEQMVTEDEVTGRARERGEELGSHPLSPATGAALRMLSASLGARAVLEIGTGTGVSGLWLLAGMPADGVLTTIESEAEYAQAARTAFREAKLTGGRTRVINDRALDVLPRMATGAYDLVVCDGDPAETTAYLAQARRVLRPGGAIAVVHALLADQVSDPARRDPETVAMRQAIIELYSDENLLVTTLTCGDGLAVVNPL